MQVLHSGRPFGPALVAAILAAALFLVSGCSAESLATQYEQLALQATETSVAGATSANRLLVQGTDGNIYTMKPTGRERIALTEDAGGGRQYVQPTWSPRGDAIAWTSIESDGSSTRSALITSRADGSGRSELTVPFPPFYIYWSPQGERLAYLSNWSRATEPSMALRIVDLVVDDDGDVSAEAKTVAEASEDFVSELRQP